MSAFTLIRLGTLAVTVGSMTACLSVREPRVSLTASVHTASAPLEITTGTAVPYSGTTLPLYVSLHQGDNVVAVPVDSVRWESSSPVRAWITKPGVADLHAVGPVVITARYREVVATERLVVRENPAASVVMDGIGMGNAFVGDTIALHASALDRTGARINGAVPSFALASRGELDPGARISIDGRFVADRPGTYLVIATMGTRAAQLPIRVGLPPIADPLPLPTATATADAAHGVMMLPAVQSTVPPTRRVRIVGARYEPYVGTIARLTARVWVGESGEPDTSAIVRWTSSDSSVAVVDGMGSVVLLRRGQVAISARHGNKIATKRFNVINAPAADLLVRTNAGFVRAGEVVRLATWVWALGGTRVTHGRPNYAIVDRAGNAAAQATISESGAFVARVPGVYTVVAQLGNLASTATFVVYPAGGHCELRLRRWDPSCAN